MAPRHSGRSRRPAPPFRLRATAAALALACAACGGGDDLPPYVAPPAPDCAPPRAPDVAAVAAPVGPADEPGACRRPVGQSALPSARALRLGALAANAAARFEVPSGTGSFTILQQAVAASTARVTFAGSVPLQNAPVPLRVLQPGGGLFFDDAAALPADRSQAAAVTYGGRQGTGAFTAPGTSRSLAAWARGVPAGTWTLVAGDYAAECANVGAPACTSGADTSGVYDVTVLLRPGPVPSTGTVDVDFYLVTGATALRAATAAADPGVQRMLASLTTLFARAGLCLGTATFLDVPAWARARYAAGVDASQDGPCDPASQLFTLSRPGTALPVFLVDDILSGGGSGARTKGADGSIPGPSSVGGTVASGTLVSLADLGHGTCGAELDVLRCGADATAAVVAHEAGHWLGLFHVTERSGVTFDPLADTATCACSACAPATQRGACGTPAAEVGAAECAKGGSCAGAENLMFWLVGGDQLSAQQGQAMRANPLVR